MANKNAIINKDEILNDDLTESFDFDELEKKLQGQLEKELGDMEFLVNEKQRIGSPENLGNVIMDVVWEQFLNQIAITAGEDFIKENKGLTLDLRKEAHIQTTDNFAKGKIATHNTEIDFQERYEDWQSNFIKDENGNIVTHKTRTGKDEATLTREARKPFDKGRPKGSMKNKIDIDHTISTAEIIRDPAANAHMTKDDQISFANSDVNLSEMNSSMNKSKSDKSMTEWLDIPNANKQKPNEIFDISTEDDVKMRQKDAKAREEYEKLKKEAEKKSIELGKKSQKQETFRIGGKALRAVLMQLLVELVKDIIGKLVKWFKSAKKNLETLLDSLKGAIHSFIGKMKTHLINAGNTVFSTIVTSIIGPVFATIRKLWIMLKQGWSSLKKAVNYIKDPRNKEKPIGILMMEVGKIIIVGLTGVGALFLGEVIEKGLMVFPIFKFEIPLLGSLANILGIFFGAVVSGIIGAIALNIIEKQIEKSIKRDNINAQLKKGNEILNLQHKVQVINEAKVEHIKFNSINNIHERHAETANIMEISVKAIKDNCATDQSIKEEIDLIAKLFNELED